MGKTKDAQRKLLEALGKTPKSKKELRKIVKASNPKVGKHLKKALRKLEERGEIKKDGKTYHIASVITESDTKMKEDKPVPIAMQMRTKASQAETKSVKFSEPEVDLDEEIRRLEQELEDSNSSDDSNSVDDEDENEKGVLSLSQYADDRPEHLPKSCLPKPGRYSARASVDPRSITNTKGHTKADIVKRREEQNKSSGLKEAVQEVLDGYKARSSEKLPFYCRYCAKQYNNETEFLEHKQTDFHETAVAMEKKATYCRLCMKQLTSPPQMKEHLASRPHKERMQSVRNRQRGSKNQRGDTKRQWC
jgi:hypothetical protein